MAFLKRVILTFLITPAQPPETQYPNETTKEQIEYLLEANFSVPDISEILGVSPSTIQGRMRSRMTLTVDY